MDILGEEERVDGDSSEGLIVPIAVSRSIPRCLYYSPSLRHVEALPFLEKDSCTQRFRPLEITIHDRDPFCQQGWHPNFSCISIKIIRGSYLDGGADLCVSTDPSHWIRIIMVTRLCVLSACSSFLQSHRRCRLLETSALSDVSLKTLLVSFIVVSSTHVTFTRLADSDSPPDLIIASCNSSRPIECGRPSWQPPALLRFVACTRTPSASKRDVPSNCSRLQSIQFIFHAHRCYTTHTRTSPPDSIHQQVLQLSLLRRFLLFAVVLFRTLLLLHVLG